MFEEDFEKNEVERTEKAETKKAEIRTVAKHTKLGSGLLQPSKREHLLTLGSLQKGP